MDFPHKREEFAKKIELDRETEEKGRDWLCMCVCVKMNRYSILFVRERVMVMVWCQEMAFHCLSLIFTDKVLSSIIIIS